MFVGTGGDKLNLFNVSTTSIFVLAAAGLVVVKHGNRGITSKSGGADVLEALGIRIDLPPAEFADCVRETGLGFLFAQQYHPAFKAVAPVRKQLAEEGIRTIFNLLGPLLNPVRPDHQLIGVFSPELPPIFAEILSHMGRKRAWAVHGKTETGAPMDELSTLGTTLIAETNNRTTAPVRELSRDELNLAPATLDDLVGGDASENARILTRILDQSERGPKRDIVVLNSAAGMVIGGMADSIEEGMRLAHQLIDSGAALEKLHRLQAAAKH